MLRFRFLDIELGDPFTHLRHNFGYAIGDLVNRDARRIRIKWTLPFWSARRAIPRKIKRPCHRGENAHGYTTNDRRMYKRQPRQKYAQQKHALNPPMPHPENRNQTPPGECPQRNAAILPKQSAVRKFGESSVSLPPLRLMEKPRADPSARLVAI